MFFFIKTQLIERAFEFIDEGDENYASVALGYIADIAKDARDAFKECHVPDDMRQTLEEAIPLLEKESELKYVAR